MIRGDSGLAVLYTVLLIPTFLILLAFVVEIGGLRLMRARLTAAADAAATIATQEQDVAALARDGRYHLTPDAAAVARDMLAREIEPLAGALASATPSSLAADADVAVLEPDQVDPLTRRAYGAPSVRISVRVPVRTPLLLLAALRDATTLQILSVASAR